jgi:hypothetical protein
MTEWPSVLFNAEFQEKVQHAKLHFMGKLLRKLCSCSQVLPAVDHLLLLPTATGMIMSVLPTCRSTHHGCLQLVLEALAASC